jgi:hypothetical protein
MPVVGHRGEVTLLPHFSHPIIPSMAFREGRPVRVGLCQQRYSHLFTFQPVLDLALFAVGSKIWYAVDVLEYHTSRARCAILVCIAKAIAGW